MSLSAGDGLSTDCDNDFDIDGDAPSPLVRRR
jgi:hypothetical protein